ncbi:MAG: photosystem II stability/assembly factor-like uncharacterized protein [Planctomycetota bacterium]|jgi:photosystem II stability/assembly factor-like uncharacterized protein
MISISSIAVAALACFAPHLQEQDLAVSGADRLAAWETHMAREEDSPFSSLEWRALGPKNCGGRIESVDSPAGQPSIIYAGVGSGGVWKSINGGLSWEHVFSRESTFAVGDVTVDPTEAETVWVGTGEAHLGGKSYDGTGVFKSTNGGSTWTNMGLVDSARIGKVLVHPQHSDVVYVAAIGRSRRAGGQRGVYKSTDGGDSWERSLFAGERVAIIDLVMDPFDPDRLWAAAWDRAGKGRSGVFRTLDGGGNWERLGGGLLSGKDAGRVALAVAASERGVVYALMVDHSPPGEGRYDVGGALFRSEDGGDTWSRTSAEYVDTYVGWDFCDVMVSPDDANEVYVCGMRLMVSRDAGATFERGGEQVFRLLEHPGKGLHLDMHDLWIDPANPDRVLLGSDGGLYLSMDRARTWLHLNNLPIAEFYTVHLDNAQPFRIWGGTQDNASLVAPSTTTLVDQQPDDWRYVFLDQWDGGDGFATFPDPSGDGTEYYEHQNGDMRRKRPGAPVRWQRASGRRITPSANKGEPALRFSWNTPLLPSRHAGGVLYCGTQYVMRSTDRGDSWQRISEDLTGGRGAILSLSESPLDGQRLVSGAGRGLIFLTDDGGGTWQAAGKGLPSVPLRSVRTSTHQAERVYVCLSGADEGDRRPYLYLSEDYGKSWKSLAGELPVEPVNVVLEDPTQPGIIYLGTDLGVYVSVDDGATWLSLCHGLPTAPVEDMGLNPEEATLVVVTHGLSAFALDVSSIAAKK